ncbi:MAG: class I SAM-dependent methyltransferase [Lawsonella clevelandensis]
MEYIFSDLTTFFLDTARELWPELQYQIFDINRPHTEQGIADASIDLLIGVNVFHNCPNMVQLLTNLHGMLAPGGQLAATESTVPSPVLMSTVESRKACLPVLYGCAWGDEDGVYDVGAVAGGHRQLTVPHRETLAGAG